LAFSTRIGAIVITIAIAVLAPANASALPYLTVGNARHALEQRFEQNEERYNNRAYTLDNCYRVSRTHVNCYTEVRASVSDCEEELWRVWEVPLQHHPGWFGMDTEGQDWGACPEESE